jgi:hypothetical protein
MRAHQALDPVTPDLDAVATERQPGAPVAVTVEVLGVDIADALQQGGIFDAPP